MLSRVLSSSTPASTSDELIAAFQAQFGASDEMMNLFSLTTGKVIAQNAAASAAVGYDDDDIADMPIGGFFPDRELAKMEAAFRRLVRVGFVEVEVQMRLKSGQLATLLMRSFLIQREPEPICLTHTVRVNSVRESG